MSFFLLLKINFPETHTWHSDVYIFILFILSNKLIARIKRNNNNKAGIF